MVHLLHGEGTTLLRAPTVCRRRTWTDSKSPPLQFKDQVVREAVEKICREFSGQCCIHKPLGGGGGGAAGGAGGGRGEAVGGGEGQQVPEVSSTLPGAPSSSTPPCSSCRGQTTGGGYQCRLVVKTYDFFLVPFLFSPKYTVFKSKIFLNPFFILHFCNCNILM